MADKSDAPHALGRAEAPHGGSSFTLEGLIHLYGAKGGKKGVWGGEAAPKLQ